MKTFSISPLKCIPPKTHKVESSRLQHFSRMNNMSMNANIQVQKFCFMVNKPFWINFDFNLYPVFFYLPHQSTFSLVPFIFILFRCVFLLFDLIFFGLNWLNVQLQLRKLCISLDIDHDLPQNIIYVYINYASLSCLSILYAHPLIV